MTQTEPDIYLKELAKKLRAIKRKGLASQCDISRDTGVDQSTVSRHMNLERRRVTESARRLTKYADMLLQSEGLSTAVLNAASEFLQKGGNEAELIASIEHASRLVSGRIGRS